MLSYLSYLRSEVARVFSEHSTVMPDKVQEVKLLYMRRRRRRTQEEVTKLATRYYRFFFIF